MLRSALCAGGILIAPKVLPKSPRIVKMISYLLSLLFISVGLLPFVMLRKRGMHNCTMASWLCVRFCRIFLGITMELRGIENINRDRGGVLILNHQSVFDVLGISYLWPIIGNITTVVKKQLLYIPFFGIGLYKGGFLFIDRKKKSESVDLLIKESRAINERHSKIVVFPEGTRNGSDKLLPFKKGAFHMAIQCGCPIQPIIISHYDWLYKNVEESRAIIHILPEISTEGFHKDNINELVELCQNTMQHEYDKLNDEIRNKKLSKL